MIQCLGHRIRARGIIDFILENQDKSFDKIEENKPHKNIGMNENTALQE